MEFGGRFVRKHDPRMTSSPSRTATLGELLNTFKTYRHSRFPVTRKIWITFVHRDDEGRAALLAMILAP